MQGEIIDREDDWIGVRVVDNNGIEHKIAVNKDGTNRGHGQDGYPDDADERTENENQHVAQARKYAKYYVYRETDYDTLTPYRNPDRIAATLCTLQNHSLGEIEADFGQFYRQQASHFHEEVARPVSISRHVSGDEFVLYHQHVQLAADLDEIRGTAEQFAEEIGRLTADIASEFSLQDFLDGALEGIAARFTEEVDDDDLELDLPDFGIESTSQVYYRHYEATNETRTVGDDGLDPDPDTRLEMPPSSVESLEQFDALLSRHLLCQLRDAYVSRGIEPPAAYRVLGHGTHHDAQNYRIVDLYPDYVDPDADIPGYVA
ncbi:hypothetical protein RYH80_10145 [Halobaculum sp. MBLA0147]|uniref:hypothetical protein n=1 Tax=Halobaculum sp. MBLA0147 TaxID=3079934 RepID=UPI003525B8B5